MDEHLELTKEQMEDALDIITEDLGEDVRDNLTTETLGNIVAHVMETVTEEQLHVMGLTRSSNWG